MSDYLDPGNEELLKDFFVEAEFQVEALESNILVLENDPGNSESIDEIFRAAHTLKGGAATVQMTELAEFTHLVEDTLDELRSGRVTITADGVDSLLASIDVIKAMLEERRNDSVYKQSTADLAARLKAIVSATPPAQAKPAAARPKKQAAQPAQSTSSAQSTSLTEYEVLELWEAAGKGRDVYQVVVEFREDNPMNSVGGIQLFTLLKQTGQVLKTNPEFDELYADTFHPQVQYYVAAEQSPEEQRSKLEISDVTAQVSIYRLQHDGTAVPEPGNSTAAPTAAAPQPTPAQEPEPVHQAAAPQAPAAKPKQPAPTKAPAATGGAGAESSQSVEEAVAQANEKAAQPKATETRKQATTGSMLRVDSRRVDNLLNLVSETVINKATFNQVSNGFTSAMSEFQSTDLRYREMLKDLFDSLPGYLESIQQGQSIKEIRRQINERFEELPSIFDPVHNALKAEVAKFRNTAQNLGRIAGELQEGVMRIRMVPISQIFSRFPRLVRDLSRSLNKAIQLTIEGEETELDKSVIEDLLDPLIHCVRNSLDHGIEDPAVRVEHGKPEAGTVLLRASNEGNMILIEVQDDGGGIDVNAVRKKAIDRGLIHPNKQLSDIEVYNLIFDPGFSTARSVTNVSGRGVGLDVVKRQIEKLNGTVTVWSERGVGTRFTIKIPLTLAIIQGLLVRVGKEMYAIPITSVIDSHRIKPSDIRTLDNYEVFNVRDDVVSLVRLSRLFRIPTNETPDYHYVVIVGTNERKMGLIVDTLIGEEDVVIKPLRDHFTSSPGIAGANITGEGRVSLIIDVSQLLELGLRREKEARAAREMTIGN